MREYVFWIVFAAFSEYICLTHHTSRNNNHTWIIFWVRLFPTWQGCQQHMICTQHTKLRYEAGCWDEYDPFYDFQKEDAEFVATVRANGKDSDAVVDDTNMDVDNENNDSVDDEDGWEDMSDGGADDDEGSDELYAGFEKEIARFGLDVTPLGELVFPDGRIVGHRALSRYYKQHIRPTSHSTAVVAAQRAAGERVFDGQVININQHRFGGTPQASERHGAGKGILVQLKAKDSSSGGAAGRPVAFSTLSLYRYRAAIRKQRRGDQKGLRLLQRTKLPMNKMDKKANRLTNGVSVAHAPR
jgi:pre-60S factor REI1